MKYFKDRYFKDRYLQQKKIEEVLTLLESCPWERLCVKAQTLS